MIVVVSITVFAAFLDLAICWKIAEHRARQAILNGVNDENSSVIYGEYHIEAIGKCRYATITLKYPNVKRIEGREYVNGMVDAFRD